MRWPALLLANVALCTNVHTSHLPAVSCHRKTYEPRTEVRALFSNEGQENVEFCANANVILKTAKPTINLINFDPIHTVQCTGKILTIEFDNLEGAKAALAAWAPVADQEKLAMIAAPQHGCGGVKMGFMAVKNLQLVGKVMKATQTALGPSEVILEYKMDVSQEVPDRLQKRNSFEKTLPLNMNFDGESVEKSNIGLFNNDNENATCVDCHMKGKTVFKTNLAGTLDRLNFLKLDLTGEVTANFGLKLKVKTSVTKYLFYKTVLKKVLSPINIGGFFELGPKIALDLGLGITATITTEVQLEYGNLINFPFDFEMKNDGGFFKKPSFRFYGRPSVIPKPPKLKDGAIDFTSHIIPKFAVGFKVLGKGVELALKFDNILSVQIKAPGCDSVPVNLKLYREHKIKVDFAVLVPYVTHDIWTTGKMPLICPFCNKCPKKK